jgi:4-hydroxy-4-methyl-2-oxoglutarate aldolase
MKMLTPEQLAAIRQFDTCSILNGIETFKVRLRNEGYARPGLQWLFPSIRSVIGYASTLRVKSSNPPIRDSVFEDRAEWWSAIEALPAPRIAVVEDLDEPTGTGSVAGEVHGAIMQRLGCQGLITNGSVRDLDALETMGFGCSAGSVSPSHAYGHTVGHGQTVHIRGLAVHPGDLLMADRHGVISIPPEIAADLPAAVARLRGHERRIIDFCRSPEFSLERLHDEVR